MFDPTVSAYDSLQVGQVQTINVSYSVTDDQGSTDQGSFSIELTGTNDAPVATFSDSQSAMEGSVSINGQLTSTDVDASGSPVYALVGAEIPGLTINADGSWLFDPTVSAYDSLQVGQVQTINVSYSVTDDQGSTDQGSFSIELTGTNDAPTASSTDLILASGNEDSVYNINATDLLFYTTDVDNDDLIVKISLSARPALRMDSLLATT